MAFTIRTETRPTSTGLDGTVYILEDAASGARAEVWPALGFNCYRWRATRKGRPLDLLYADPQLFDNGRPTRSGVPILFPFPNRIRAGGFTWDGKAYELPLNDSPPRNASHGFACRAPWRVVGQTATADYAQLTGEFQGSREAPPNLDLWPADYRMRLTYRLTAEALALRAEVTNPDARPLPFGLGYHPYFRTPLVPGARAEDCLVQVGARSYWELAENLPTGPRLPVDPARDLNTPRRVAELALDDILTDLPDVVQTDGLCLRGLLHQQPDGVELRVRASPDFREMVVYTPPHRQAICLEPLTCPTDAINLQQRGIDAGWRVLPAGGRWEGIVEFVVA